MTWIKGNNQNGFVAGDDPAQSLAIKPVKLMMIVGSDGWYQVEGAETMHGWGRTNELRATSAREEGARREEGTKKATMRKRVWKSRQWNTIVAVVIWDCSWGIEAQTSACLGPVLRWVWNRYKGQAHFVRVLPESRVSVFQCIFSQCLFWSRLSETWMGIQWGLPRQKNDKGHVFLIPFFLCFGVSLLVMFGFQGNYK